MGIGFCFPSTSYPASVFMQLFVLYDHSDSIVKRESGFYFIPANIIVCVSEIFGYEISWRRRNIILCLCLVGYFPGCSFICTNFLSNRMVDEKKTI